MAITKTTPNESTTKILQVAPSSVAIPTNGWVTCGSLTIPTTSVAHNYLIIANIEFANASGGVANEFAIRFMDPNAIQFAIQYHDCHAGTYFTTSTLSYVYSTTGGIIAVQAFSQAAGRATGNRGNFMIVDLGVA